MMSETLIQIDVKELPKTCWKCGRRLVIKGRGLYCPNCKRHRKFLYPSDFQWQRRGGRVWSRVDVRMSGKMKRTVLLPKDIKFIK